MSVLDGIKNGVEGFFVAREKPREPAHERLIGLTLIGTVNMENSLTSHPGRDAIAPNLRPMHATRQSSAEALGVAAEIEQNNVLRKVINVAPAEAPYEANVTNLSPRGSDMVMDAMIETSGPAQPMMAPEEARPAA